MTDHRSLVAEALYTKFWKRNGHDAPPLSEQAEAIQNMWLGIAADALDAPPATVEIDGTSYRKFIPYPQTVDDGTPRCIYCGQIDEPKYHDDALCPALAPPATGEAGEPRPGRKADDRALKALKALIDLLDAEPSIGDAEMAGALEVARYAWDAAPPTPSAEEIEDALNWLDGLKVSGHCGESTSDIIHRQRRDARIDVLRKALLSHRGQR